MVLYSLRFIIRYAHVVAALLLWTHQGWKKNDKQKSEYEQQIKK